MKRLFKSVAAMSALTVQQKNIVSRDISSPNLPVYVTATLRFDGHYSKTVADDLLIRNP